MRQTFPGADHVGMLTFFNIGGNKARLIAAIHYNTHRVYIQQVPRIKIMTVENGRKEGINEDQYIPETQEDPIETLKMLMAEHGLKQTDLPGIGSQGVVSEILSGKRRLNMRQIKYLSNRFRVPPAVFM